MIPCLAGVVAIPARQHPMSNVCILTDSTAQFTQPQFPGHERVHVIPFDIRKVEYQEGWRRPGGISSQGQLIPPLRRNSSSFMPG